MPNLKLQGFPAPSKDFRNKKENKEASCRKKMPAPKPKEEEEEEEEEEASPQNTRRSGEAERKLGETYEALGKEGNAEFPREAEKVVTVDD